MSGRLCNGAVHDGTMPTTTRAQAQASQRVALVHLHRQVRLVATRSPLVLHPVHSPRVLRLALLLSKNKHGVSGSRAYRTAGATTSHTHTASRHDVHEQLHDTCTFKPRSHTPSTGHNNSEQTGRQPLREHTYANGSGHRRSPGVVSPHHQAQEVQARRRRERHHLDHRDF